VVSSTTLADVFPTEPFNGLQISYSVSGAGLAAPKDSEGFTFYRELEGKLTGNELTVSGMAKASGGWGATIDVSVSVDGQDPKSFHQEKFPKNGLHKDVMNQPFSVTVPVPAEAQKASFILSLEGDYNAGSRGVVVKGSLNRSYSLPVIETKNETEQTGKEQECQDGSTCPKKSLCAEAILRYFPLSPDKGAEYGSLRWDYEDLKQEWETAIDDYNENHDIKAHSSDNTLGILPAISWLWAEGGTSDTVSKRFVFTSDEDRSQFSSKPPRDGEATQGTEYALYYSIVNKFEDKKSKLTPGDVFNLALEQRNGDAREATLLAHNLLRSLARTGDQSLTMVPLCLDFFDTYLEPMIGKESLGKGQNAGNWYHLFGTAYFEMQGRGNWGFYTPVEMVVDRGVSDGLDKTVSLLMSDPELKEPSTRTLLSFLGNEVEQGVRWVVGSPSDPEKYCFNVWGGQLGAWLYREKLPKKASEEPTQEDESLTLTVPTVLGPIPMVPDSKRIMDKPSRVVYSCSPVNVLWEGEGKNMALDQAQESLEGSFPVGLIPFYEEQTESWGLLWKELSDAPYKVSFEAVKEGWHHLVIIDKTLNQTQVYFVYLLPGERTSLEIDPSGKPKDMTGPDEAAIKPLILDSEGTEMSGQEEGAKENQLIFDNTNIASVDNNPTCNPKFTIIEPHRITYIETYHWNYGQGTTVGGTIGLEKDDGTTYGPWMVQAEPGMNGVPNAYWKCRPDTVIPAGTYTVIDSDPATWSQNYESDGCGFSKVEGYSASSDEGRGSIATDIPPGPPKNSDLEWLQENAASALDDIGDPRAVDPLIESLKDEDDLVRADAASALGYIGDPRAVDPLIESLKDEDKWVRSSAALALGYIGDPRAVDPLIESLKDEYKWVRADAASALGYIGDPRAFDPLIESLKDGDEWLRSSAASALGYIGDPRAVDPLIESLKDEDKWVRSSAASALGNIGDQRAIEPLAYVASRDKEEAPRESATKALDKIQA